MRVYAVGFDTGFILTLADFIWYLIVIYKFVITFLRLFDIHNMIGKMATRLSDK